MRRGFTLIELVIALTLLMFLAGVMFPAFARSFRNWRKLAARSGDLQTRLIVAERLCREIRSATLLAASGSDEVFLRLGGETISYKLVGNKVRRKKGASSAYLTTDNEVRRLAFAYLSDGRVAVALDDLAFSAAGRN
ncbi:MAG: type II secretion system protein [Candidatus Saganbacteria bacterium]|nr:type II secretion system protein [Candidatus Saganbacteria bacterium]